MKSFFNEIIYLKTIGSTNTYLKENNHEDRTIVYTFDQTEGRGRTNKKWSNFKDKNIAISILLRSKNRILNDIWYIAVCSIALTELLEGLKIKDIRIKWPNDIYINDEKIAGILTESVWRSDKFEKTVIGIGVNVNADLNDLKTLDNKATSIFIQTQNNYELNAFFKDYLDHLSKWFSILFDEKKIYVIKNEWTKRCKIIGQKVKFNKDNEICFGLVDNIGQNGELEIKVGQNIINVLSGDVELV